MYYQAFIAIMAQLLQVTINHTKQQAYFGQYFKKNNWKLLCFDKNKYFYITSSMSPSFSSYSSIVPQFTFKLANKQADFSQFLE